MDLKQVSHVKSEKTLLEELEHPFIVSYKGFFQDDKFTYFVTEYIACGEMFDLLKERYVITDQETAFYAAQVILTLQFLHSKEVVYRDLKPENLMLCKNGFIKFIDFGLGKKLKDRRTYTLCGTPQYMAPEVIEGKGYGLSVDWWSLGILIYEMLTGRTPFDDADPYTVFKKIIQKKVHYPRWLKSSAKMLLNGLLKKRPVERLGVIQGGAERVKQQVFFDDVNFRDILLQTASVPEDPNAKKMPSPSKLSSSTLGSESDGVEISHFEQLTPSVPKRKDPFLKW